MLFDILINISTDFVHITDGSQKKLIHRNDVEDKLGPILVELLREWEFEKVLVINGPGGFTNLRAGVLCLNLLDYLQPGKIQFWSYSKFEIFESLASQKKIPNKAAINIGQKKKARLYDFNSKSHEVVNITDLNCENIFLDQVRNQSYRPDNQNMVGLDLDQGKLVCSYRSQKYIAELPSKKPTEILSPQYFVKPVIGKGK